MTDAVVVGISAYTHDSAACVMRGGRLLAAAEEERFTRRKHQGGVPVHAVRTCLASAGLGVADVDALAVGIEPGLLADRRATWPPISGVVGGARPHIDETSLRRLLGMEAPISFVLHHRAHAASAFHFSPFETAAVLVVDGVGEWQTTTIWRGAGSRLELVDEHRFPHSLGLLYSAVTEWLGFVPSSDEYKVMGLAAHGRPTRVDEIASLVPDLGAGRYELDTARVDVLDASRRRTELTGLLGRPRSATHPIRRLHADVAASLQQVLETRLLALARRARSLTGADALCTAGGVMLNAVANRRLRAEAPFERVWFQPVAGDAGTALGAASTVAAELGAARPAPLSDLRLGPVADPATAMLIDSGIPYDDLRADGEGLAEAVADLIADGAVVGWFAAGMELGPRALGARSILADPRRREIRERINRLVKGREEWRPLAPMLTEEAASSILGTPAADDAYRCMVETAPVAHDGLGAVTHEDGSTRPQVLSVDGAPGLVALLEAVGRRIGVAALVNTSFNHADEPIVATAEQALSTAIRCGLDALVIDGLLVRELPTDPAGLIGPWTRRDRPGCAVGLYPL